MTLFKDEIYLAWDEKSTNVVNSLYDQFEGQIIATMDVHVFLHQNKMNKDYRMVTWPENFFFHFTSTGSHNALQTSMIAYILEKFERISREIEFEDITDKVKIFFIQESQSQFDELKAMLVRIPLIKNAFSFKLLAVSDSVNTEMLFTISSGHNKRRNTETRSSNNSFNSTRDSSSLSPRLPRHGRRASNYPHADEYLNSTSKGRFSLYKIQRETPATQCKHCERMRGSQPKFNVLDKNFFCMACFLDGRITDNDLCRKCQRNKNIDIEDKATDLPFQEFFKDFSVQCKIPVRETKSAYTSMPESITNHTACQTDITMVNEINDGLQAKFFALLDEIDRSQKELINSTPLPSKIPVPIVPKLNIDNQFGISDNPFTLSKARKDPLTNKFHCPFCQGSVFPKIEIFEVHLRNVHKKCNCSCEQYFPTREDYLEHFYTVFPLPCFELRKCPERFRSLPYQAIHHAKVHQSEKPYYCCICYDVQQKGMKVNFKNLRALKMHAKEMGHHEDDLFLKVIKNEENEKIPLTGRASTINFSGDF